MKIHGHSRDQAVCYSIRNFEMRLKPCAFCDAFNTRLWNVEFCFNCRILRICLCQFFRMNYINTFKACAIYTCNIDLWTCRILGYLGTVYKVLKLSRRETIFWQERTLAGGVNPSTFVVLKISLNFVIFDPPYSFSGCVCVCVCPISNKVSGNQKLKKKHSLVCIN